MSKVTFDVLLYIPFLFITTILVGLKLDNTKSLSHASWSLITLPLIIYLPSSVLVFFLQKSCYHIRIKQETSDLSTRLEIVDENDTAYKLPPFVYTKDILSISVSLVIWAYITLVPSIVFSRIQDRTFMKMICYILSAILMLVMIVVLVDNLCYIFSKCNGSVDDRHQYANKRTNLSSRLGQIIKLVKQSIRREIHQENETKEMLDKHYRSSKHLSIRMENGYPVDIQTLETIQQDEIEERMKTVQFSISNPQQVEEIPDIEDFFVDDNIATDNYNEKDHKSKKSSSLNEEKLNCNSIIEVLWKGIKFHPYMDMRKQTTVALNISIIISLSLIFAGLHNENLFYMKLAFVIPGALFICIIFLVIMKKRVYRTFVWCGGLIIATVVYITINLMLYEIGHKMKWITAFIPLLILEVYIAIICICDI